MRDDKEGREFVVFQKTGHMNIREVFDTSLDAAASLHSAFVRSGRRGFNGQKVVEMVLHETSHHKPVDKYHPQTTIRGLFRASNNGLEAGLDTKHEGKIPLLADMKSDIQPLIDNHGISANDKTNFKDKLKRAISNPTLLFR